MKVSEISVEKVIDSPKGDYNRSEWIKTVKRMSGYEDVRFFERTDKTEFGHFPIYAIYMIEGIRFILQVSFSGSLSSNGFGAFMILDGEIVRDADLTARGTVIEDTRENRVAMVSMCVERKNLFFSKGL